MVDAVTYRELEGHPGHLIGSDGTILKRMAEPLNGMGYPHVNLTNNKRNKKFALHRVIAWTFLGPIPDGMVVRHLNDVKTDCRVENLAIGTQRDNIQDAKRNGITWGIRKGRTGVCGRKPTGVPYKDKVKNMALRLPAEIMEELRSIASLENTSVSVLINRAIEEKINTHD